MTARLMMSVVALTLIAAAPLVAEDGKVKVVVVSVLATSKDHDVDRRLKELAPEVQKKDPTLTGFKVERISRDSIAIGSQKSIKLLDDCELTIVVKERDETGCVSIILKPPTIGEIAYSCCCDKFFPIVTRYETKDGKRLVIAVMAMSCTKKN